MKLPETLGIAEIVLIGSVVLSSVAQWFILNERVDILEQRLTYYKTVILENAAYRDEGMVVNAEQTIRLKHIEDDINK